MGLQIALYSSLLVCVFLHYIEGSVECPPREFKCTNGSCISIYKLCDGYNNCGDNSDENSCEPFLCHRLSPFCLNGKCSSFRLTCHGTEQCGRKSDEIECVPIECDPKEFKCRNGECINMWLVCNGREQCADDSDEKVCDPFQCHPSAFQCPNGKCITRIGLCDGFDDCGDYSDEKMCEPFQCHPSAFQCSNGKCRSRLSFCLRGDDNCGDNSDEEYCSIGRNGACPPGWSECPNHGRCLPSHWMCDGYPDCSDASDERNCERVEIKIPDFYVVTPDIYAAKMELKSYILSRRKSYYSTIRWGSQVHRIAVTLHLADSSTFAPRNSTGKEISDELTMQLLHRLPRNKMSSHKLAMYVHAMMVSCLDPMDFYGSDLVRELRRRVEATGNYTNPFLILVLCNAGDNMTASDVQRVTTAYYSQQRPFWTDSQALSCMALSCIASRNSGLVDERTFTDMLQELKKQQLSNGTVGNFKTTALVTQALFFQDSFKENFDLNSSIKVLVDGLNGSKSLLNAYYALPVLHGKSLLHVSSRHCRKRPVKVEDTSQETLDDQDETINVQYSVWMGDELNFQKSLRLKMVVNSTIYDAIQTAAKIDTRQKVQYNVVDGKPYVESLEGIEDDPEMGTFWFIFLKPLETDERLNFIEQSPVDVELMSGQEIILWYKSAPWVQQNYIQDLVAST